MSNKRLESIVRLYFQSNYINPSDYNFLKDLYYKRDEFSENSEISIDAKSLIIYLYNNKIPKILKIDNSFADYIKNGFNDDPNYIANLMYNFGALIGHGLQNSLNEDAINLEKMFFTKTMAMFIQILFDYEFSSRDANNLMTLESFQNIDQFFIDNNIDIFTLYQPNRKDMGLLYSKDATYIITPNEFGPIIWIVLHLTAWILTKKIYNKFRNQCMFINLNELKQICETTDKNTWNECTKYKILTCQFRDFLLNGLPRILKCPVCVDNYMSKLDGPLNFRDRFSQVNTNYAKELFDLHNKVNENLGKSIMSIEEFNKLNKRLDTSLKIHKNGRKQN